jgi:hypothetical protein
MVEFQVSWSTKTPGETHASFSGDRTPCGDGLPVIEAKPFYDSKLEDVTCVECAAHVVYDMNEAREAARKGTADMVARGALSEVDDFQLREEALRLIPPKVYAERREGKPWGAIKTDFLLIAAGAPDHDATGGYVGMLGLAIIDSLEKSENTDS